MKRGRQRDPVSPELAAYVLRRDGGCIPGLLGVRGLIPDPGFCAGSLTVAHVRDARGGRLGRRPPSKPRRLVAVCEGHHLIDPVVDRKDVRPVVDEYLELREGPDVDDLARPWEVVSRVRGNLDWRPSEEGGTDAATRTEGPATHPGVRR